MVIILFNTGLDKSAFYTYFLEKLVFPLFMFSLHFACLYRPCNIWYYYSYNYPGIFPNNFSQPVNGCKNSILNWVIKLHHVSFFLFVFVIPLKEFPFYSPILFTLWFRYLQTRKKESCTHCIFRVNFSSKLPMKL